MRRTEEKDSWPFKHVMTVAVVMFGVGVIVGSGIVSAELSEVQAELTRCRDATGWRGWY